MYPEVMRIDCISLPEVAACRWRLAGQAGLPEAEAEDYHAGEAVDCWAWDGRAFSESTSDASQTYSWHRGEADRNKETLER